MIRAGPSPAIPVSLFNFHSTMQTLITSLPPVAAIGYSMLYLVFGGGLFGAGLIFIVAKIFRK